MSSSLSTAVRSVNPSSAARRKAARPRSSSPAAAQPHAVLYAMVAGTSACSTRTGPVRSSQAWPISALSRLAPDRKANGLRVQHEVGLHPRLPRHHVPGRGPVRVDPVHGEQQAGGGDGLVGVGASGQLELGPAARRVRADGFERRADQRLHARVRREVLGVVRASAPQQPDDLGVDVERTLGPRGADRPDVAEHEENANSAANT